MEVLEQGRLLTTLLRGADARELWEHCGAPLRRVFGSVEGLARFQRDVASAGAELRVIDERVTPWIGADLYSRQSAYANVDRALIQWSITREGLADGLLVVPLEPAADTAMADYETRAPLRLPFDGEWFVFWGGRDIIDNAHVVARDQRFAADFVIVKYDATHTGDGTLLRQYHCFGQPVLAPAAGTVVRATDGIDDNRPGVMNERQPLGNHVIIDHGGGEYSFIAHLERGSVGVNTGSVVVAGAGVGRCGNSGNSSEPHIHYHLQSTAQPFRGEGLPAQFRSYVADGVRVDRGEPGRGQRVEQV